MRDPYLYDDADVLINLAGIKDAALLRQAEADITSLTMAGIYNKKYERFDGETLQDIHRTIFGHIYPWAGEFRTIQMVKYEDILGGDSVRYAHPSDIRKQLHEIMKEIGRLKRTGMDDREVIFRMVRIISAIWQIHPFREGNTRSVIVFSVLLANSMGFEVEHSLFKRNPAYVRNSLVWCCQGMYSKYQYLEKIFFDAMLHDRKEEVRVLSDRHDEYASIGDYDVRNYRETPHEYMDE